MSWLTDLQDSRDQIASQIKDLTENPKPSYSIDGQSISWTQHFEALVERLKDINDAINAAEPYEEHSVGYSE